jgi:DNA-binding transcriptional LysR family regulator
MPAANLSAIDLNLLVVLDALLTEHSVSRAAKRLNSTQPAVSRSLGRLRAWFGDPLLTRTRHGMVPTPAGLALADDVRDVLARLQSIVARRDSFDPPTSRRTFRLTMSEYPQLAVCGPLLAHVLPRAPHVGVDILPWSLAFPEGLESGTLDLAVCPPTESMSGIHAVPLLRDDLVVVVRKGHPAADGELTLARYAALKHVQSAPNGRPGSVIDDLLAVAGHARRVVLRVPSAVVGPALCAMSDCCATLPSRLAATMAEAWGLVILPLPFDAPAIGLDLFWHQRSHADPGNAWLRGELRALFATRARPRARGVSRIDLVRRSKRTL